MTHGPPRLGETEGISCESAVGEDSAGGREAQRRIELITADVGVGRIYEGRVARLMDFGAFVTILPGRDGLVHISQISDERVERVSDKLKEGDVVRVKVLEVDRQGRVRLSMRSVDAAYISIAKVMGADERQTFFKVVLPAASPWIITAMKVSVPFALVGAIVGEFMAATAGLGFKIQLYTAQFDTTGAVTGVFVLMLVVVMFNTALNRLEAHILRWRPETSAGRGSEVQ